MRGDDEASHQGTSAEMRCDFCNHVVSSVRRVALDGDYERLRTPHTERYACPACFEKKDRERLASATEPR